MNEEIKKEIVLDLINLTPRGPSKTCPNTKEYKTYGYESKVLFALELHTKYAVELYISKLFRGTAYLASKPLKGSVASVQTRRINRVWSRLEPVVKDMWSNGGRGIYSVSFGKYYGADKIGHIFAVSPEEAKTVAEMCFGYLLKKLEADKIFVRYVSSRGADYITNLNSSLETALKHQKNTILRTLASADLEIEKINLKIEAMKIAEGSMP